MEKITQKNLKETPLRALPLGSIKPKGWLLDQLNIQAEGFTGNLEEHWKDVGAENGWLGGDGDSWERGPYYLDGLVPLAYLLEDESLIQKSEKWIEWALNSQREDGSFGPTQLNQEDKIVAEYDWWQEMIMLKVLTQYQEATNDQRVIPFMTKYFKYLRETLLELPLHEWAEARGADLLISIHWLYERTEDAMLLELMEIVEEQTIEWTDIFSDFPYWRKQEEWNHRIHVVNVAMGIKTPALFYRRNDSNHYRESIYKGINSLMKHHGQAHGMFSGDEWLSGTHPSQGVELCAVVEYMFSMENIIRILGDGVFGDILEKVAFNALPATISPNWDAHQYDQQVNQVISNKAKRPWVNDTDANIFGLEPNFGCCTANMHQGWPKFVSSLWMGTKDQGLAAISYAPCNIETKVLDDIKVGLRVEGDYPFREQVSVSITLEKDAEFPLYFRIPKWCNNPEIKVNGNDQKMEIKNNFAIVRRTWSNDDFIEINLPMNVELEGRNNQAVSVNRGPLVYVLPIEEQWVKVKERELFHDWEIYPKQAWQYALVSGAEFKLELKNIEKQPFDVNSPVKLITKGKLLSNWIMENNSAGEPPLNPTPYSNAADEIELIPYGSARLRIGEFPVINS